MLRKRDSFTKAIIKEIESRANDYCRQGFDVKTIYFGGGTPSVMAPKELRDILESVLNNYPLVKSGKPYELEVTIELNPDDITASYASELLRIGFNRISLGVQSFCDQHLSWMNRRHNAVGAIKAYETLKEVGFNNISIDLIFGYQMLSNLQWRENIQQAIALSPQHLSCYQLSIEKGTKLYNQFISNNYTPSPDNNSLKQYLLLQHSLEAAGYYQYEISSFCRPGKESRHNSSYWDFTPYFGFGPSAHSFNGVEREWNSVGINKYIEGWSRGIRHYRGELLSSTNLFNEFIMLSLRTTAGIDKESLQYYMKNLDLPIGNPDKIFAFEKAIEENLSRSNLIDYGSAIAIPRNKLFISDSIIRELFIV